MEHEHSQPNDLERHLLGDLLDDEGFSSWKLDDAKSSSDVERSSFGSANINVTPDSVQNEFGCRLNAQPTYSNASTRHASNTDLGSLHLFPFFSSSSAAHQSGTHHHKHGPLACSDQNAPPAHLPRPQNLPLERTFSQVVAKKNLPLLPVVALSNGGRSTPPVPKKTTTSARARSKPRSFAPLPVASASFNQPPPPRVIGLNPVDKSKKGTVAREADFLKVSTHKKKNQPANSNGAPKAQKAATNSSAGKHAGTPVDVKPPPAKPPKQQPTAAAETNGVSSWGFRKFAALQQLTETTPNEQRGRFYANDRRSPSLSVRSTRSDISDGSADGTTNNSGGWKRAGRSQQSSGSSSPVRPKTFNPTAFAASLFAFCNKPKGKRRQSKRRADNGLISWILSLLLIACHHVTRGAVQVATMFVEVVYMGGVAVAMLFRSVVKKVTKGTKIS
ncbi:hypothetical protein M3Y99_01204000 [Aphelenchoides fujianensis]|nr:hypothetical protein M3Y99_01204000 [Aphelenchoides fujianensis]